MKKSLWLQEYEKAVNGKRQKSNQNKNVIFLVIPIVFLLFMVSAVVTGGISDPQAKMGILCMAGIVILILIFALIMVSKGKKMDVTKHTRENVLALLRNDDEVTRFDQQMHAAPILEVNIASETSIFLTEDYVGEKYMSMGNLMYTFIRRSDIASFHSKKSGSTTANPINASFFFDIRDGQQNVILNGQTDSGKQLEKLKELLSVAQPTIQVD